MKERLWISLWLPVLFVLYRADLLRELLFVIVIFGVYEVMQRKPQSIWRYVAILQIVGLLPLILLPAKQITYAVLVVAANDMFAFFGGKYFTFHRFMRIRIFPLTSPNKTSGGLLYGLLLGTVVGWMVVVFGSLPQRFTYFAPFVCLLAVMGDYVESKFKRHYHIKDSGEGLFTGKLLRGHGGVYDRFDAIAFTAPAMWLLDKIF